MNLLNFALYCSASGGASRRNRPNNCPTSDNRVARFRYEIIERHECGISLTGSEIKSVRKGGIQLRDGFARVSKNEELILHNVHIAAHDSTGKFDQHEAVRERRLLLHKRIIRKLGKETAQKGLTLIPLKTYFSDRGWLKVEVGLCRGKKLEDKRDVIKKREQDREMKRAIKIAM
eukprot:Plantae.Rhodophyta-Rhodochaete_pulchella.ctg28199.p2 GENE.Plantae.Rhodophyta-Rhodochaete_pulchella.ctg28199~~Plantae.Rhodophyta-Rhodochaete_pulchella.ctg28199.p2  ORF type:complete len:175 (-),score=29.20 Plantae.Rhodophyta-Rhodochaete_pulchella.ctg28199:56-580(-)